MSEKPTYMSVDYWEPFEEGKTYHIYNRAGTALMLFHDVRDYHAFLRKWKKYFSNYLSVYAYCLIPNHFHILARIKEIDQDLLLKIAKENTIASREFLEETISYSAFISDQFRRFGSSVSLAHKNRYGRYGALFQNKVKRISTKSEVHLFYLLCYIHHNVIHHRLGRKYADWPYSSYRAYFSDQSTSIDKESILRLVGGIDEFSKMHEEFELLRSKKELEIDNPSSEE